MATAQSHNILWQMCFNRGLTAIELKSRSGFFSCTPPSLPTSRVCSLFCFVLGLGSTRQGVNQIRMNWQHCLVMAAIPRFLGKKAILCDLARRMGGRRTSRSNGAGMGTRSALNGTRPYYAWTARGWHIHHSHHILIYELGECVWRNALLLRDWAIFVCHENLSQLNNLFSELIDSMCKGVVFVTEEIHLLLKVLQPLFLSLTAFQCRDPTTMLARAPRKHDHGE